MNTTDTVTAESLMLTALPMELLQRILSQLPMEDQLNAPSISRRFRDASYGAAHVSLSLSFASVRSAHAAQGRTWRPAKSLVVLWFHRRRASICSLAFRDALKPFSDEDAPALILPLVAANLHRLQLQVLV